MGKKGVSWKRDQFSAGLARKRGREDERHRNRSPPRSHWAEVTEREYTLGNDAEVTARLSEGGVAIKPAFRF